METQCARSTSVLRIVAICVFTLLILSPIPNQAAISTGAGKEGPARQAIDGDLMVKVGFYPLEDPPVALPEVDEGLSSSLAADQPARIGPIQPQRDENGELVVVFPSDATTAPPSANQPADPQGYIYDIADTAKCVGFDLALDLDPNGRPHLLYYNACEQDLMYAYRDETGWTVHQFYSAAGDDIGSYLDLDVDQYGVPHIVFYNATQTSLRYLSRDISGAFFSENIDSSEDSGSHCSVTVDRYQRIHASYYQATSGDLMHKMRNDTGWNYVTESVDVGGRGKYSSIAVNSWARPHFTYADEYANNLRYAWQESASTWHTEVVDSASGVAARNSLAIDSLDQSHVSYYTSETNDLKYAYKDSTGWTIIGFPDSHDMGWFNALALDANDHPHIVAWDDTEKSVNLIYNRGAGWYKERVYLGASSGVNGGFTDLALDLYGNPVLGFVNTDRDVVAATVDSPAFTIPANLKGYRTWTINERDVNHCAVSVVSQFNSLRDHGEVMGFNLNDHPYPRYNIYTWNPFELDFHNHWQGMQRLTTGNGTMLLLTQDEIRRPCDGGTCKHSGFALVNLSTRLNENTVDYSNFGRYRSNRLNPLSYLHQTAPNTSDGIEKTVYISDVYTHIGAIQVIGQILAVPLEAKDPQRAIINFYDLQYNPFAMPEDAVTMQGAETLEIMGSSGTSSALTKLNDGRYLLAVSSTKLDGGIHFQISYAPHTLAYETGYYVRFVPLDWFSSSEVVDAPGVVFQYDGWDSYQAINFITECSTGDLYLIASGNLGTSFCYDNQCTPDGADVADLYKVTIVSEQVKLTRVAQRHFYCAQHGSGGGFQHCNFDAAMGAYVTDESQLYLYSSEHANDGPKPEGEDDESIKFMEFRPVPHNTCNTIEDAWVELYDNTFYDSTLGEGLMIDYVDRNLENYLNYDDAEDFEDQAEAVSWCLPSGWAYRIYQHKNPCRGKLLTLYGNNAFYSIKDLDQYGMKDKASCSFFTRDAPVSAGVSASGARLIYIFTVEQSQTDAASPTLVGQATQDTEADLQTTIDFPAGTFEINTTAIYTPSTPTSPPEGMILVGSHSFLLGVSPQADFKTPAQITIEFADFEIEGLYPETMTLYYYLPGYGWRPSAQTLGRAIPPEVNLEQGWIKTELSFDGEYALFAKRKYEVFLPVLLRDHNPNRSALTDPAGDWLPGAVQLASTDIRAATVERRLAEGVVVFTLSLASPLPPTLPAAERNRWIWLLDADQNAATGDPWYDLGIEYEVNLHIQWDGFYADVRDWQNNWTSVPGAATIAGDTVTLRIPISTLGGAIRFNWMAAVEPFDREGTRFDIAPNSGYAQLP